MALGNLKNKNQQNQEPGYGVIIKVSSATKAPDGVMVNGEIQNTCALGEEGDKVLLNGDKKALINMTNGGAKFNNPDSSAGTILMLEAARSQGMDENNVLNITANYLTTISSPSKNYDGGLMPDWRSAVATAPVITFPNVNPADGEPRIIYWATNMPDIKRRVKEGDEWKTNTFDREWMADKYKEAVASGKRAKVHIDTYNPEEATPVSSASDIAETIQNFSQKHENCVVLLRAYDDKDVWSRKITVRSTKVGDEWVPDPEGTVGYYDKNGYFKGVANENLFADVEQGGSALEVIPGNRLYYPHQSAEGLIEKTLLNPPHDKDGNSFNVTSFTFGKYANNCAKVLLSGLIPSDTGFLPTNFVRETPGLTALRNLATPNHQPAMKAEQHEPTPNDPMSQDDDMSLGDIMDNEEFNQTVAKEEEKSSAPSPGM